jgi:mono/diheme cytochrome c family protein
MRLIASGVVLAWLAGGAVMLALPPANAQRAAPSAPQADARKVLEQYCITCHNDRLRTAGFSLEHVDVSLPGADAAVWEKVVQKLRSRTMPPVDKPRPDEATYESVAAALEASLDRSAAAQPNPGRPLLHRMNRTEYRNAIRDLLALDFDVSALPADDATYGFDNIADALGTSPLLLESYMTAARKAVRLAVGSPAIPPATISHAAAEDLTQDYHLRDLPLGTRGGLRVEHYFPVDATYEIRVRLRRNAGGTVRGIGEEHQVELTLDGNRLGVFPIGGRGRGMGANAQSAGQPAATGFTADDKMFARLKVPAGTHTIVAAFVGRPPVLSEQTARPFLRSYTSANGQGMADVDRVMITGPFEAARPNATPSRTRIFSCRPTTPADERGCARTILTRLGRLAYRRPLAPAELDLLLGFYDEERRKGDFESGVELALRYILTSPQFIFRVETEPAKLAAGAAYALTDFDLASRLSFFLWSSIPDEALLAAAERGDLGKPAELDRQVRRMLADPRADALVENFAGQWLYLRNLTGTRPDPPTFPDFDDNLRQSLRRETELFVSSVMQENRSVLDLLTADYTFVNERLARHYGIPGIYGDRFRRIQVTDDRRLGLLGHGSVLTVTSYATRTSPVLRGKWILENLLSAPPPPPPPNVPNLEDTGSAEALSVRERLVRHRTNPGCAGCHARMDPYGFGLENFDAIGRWRETESDGKAIDASDTLPDGTVFRGPSELRAAILRRPDEFLRTFTRKLLTYAVGRGLDHHDEPIVRRIVSQAARDQHRFASIVTGIVRSEAFRMKVKRQG